MLGKAKIFKVLSADVLAPFPPPPSRTRNPSNTSAVPGPWQVQASMIECFQHRHHFVWGRRLDSHSCAPISAVLYVLKARLGLAPHIAIHKPAPGRWRTTWIVVSISVTLITLIIRYLFHCIFQPELEFSPYRDVNTLFAYLCLLNNSAQSTSLFLIMAPPPHHRRMHRWLGFLSAHENDQNYISRVLTVISVGPASSLLFPMIFLSLLLISFTQKWEVKAVYEPVSSDLLLPQDKMDDSWAYHISYSASAFVTWASWSSSFATIFPSFVMTLLSYNGARRIMEASNTGRVEDLPTPY